VKHRTWIVLFISLGIIFGIGLGTGLADKAAVAISAPASVPRGTEVPVKITITHSANSFFHYTEWVTIKVNGKEAARWEYSMTNRPEGATFVREIKIPVNEAAEIVAEASCNLHGSTGPAAWRITAN
jgi:desulfoferrodoxin (superoxide reductase-like protein)